jgi:hypothetical protein
MAIIGPFEFTIKYIGSSNDTKPSDIPKGSGFYETDTGLVYIFDGSSWYVTEELKYV